MGELKIKIAKDFSSTPGPRYEKEGYYSGERFRSDILKPALEKALRNKRKLIVDLDGTEGYGTSFLEESFGGLIREEGFSYSQITKTIEIVSEEEDFLKEDIEEYLEDAKNHSSK